uniref:Putative glycoside hydrolase n=1 Tax=viral metagenome TaxID=1070528 RepID=A0A6M3LU93_9ZZZZ
MNVPKNAIELATYFEGFYPKPYLCPAGFWTIGYGRLCRKDHPPISKNQAVVYLIEDLQDALNGTIRHCPVLLGRSDLWLGAIVDFVFNLGAGRLAVSTLKKRINAERWDDVPTELNKWVYGGGRKLKGLIFRREAEARFFS